jgi:mannose-1-phosphate guanylyltransferase/phosphomannomutase
VQAVIMVGGEGRRLRPLTNLMPKPLVPVMQRPLLLHLLGRLRSWGIEEVILTLGYRAQDLRDAVGDGSAFGLGVTYLDEESPLGTAGGVRQALSLLRGTFVVLSGDGLLDIDLPELLSGHRRHHNAVSLCLAQPDSGLQFGLVDSEADGRISRFVEKPRFADIFPGQGLNTGVYVMEREALAEVPEGTAWDFSHDLFPHLLAKGGRIGGYYAVRYWRDVGTIPSYLEAHWDVLTGRVWLPDVDLHLVEPGALGPDVRITPPVSVFPGATAHRGAALVGPLVIGPDCVIEAGSHLSHVVLWDHVRIGHDTHLAHLVATSHSRVPPTAHLHGGVVLGPHRAIDLRGGQVRYAGAGTE